MKYFSQSQTQSPEQFSGFGSWLSRAVSNVGKFVQQTDLVSHAANELGVGKSTVGKILVPTASNNINKNQTIVKKDMPKPVWVVNSVNCAKSEYKGDQKCIAFNEAQTAAVVSQEVIAVPEEKVSNKTIVIVGGAILLAGGLLYLANKKGKTALSGVSKKRRTRRAVRKVKSKK